MHRELIEHASSEQIKEFAYNALSMLKETNPNVYEDLELYLYKKIYGCHFSDWMVHKATMDMHNEDGTTGPHWTVEQTTTVAKQNNITFDIFNEYDWNYAMNMVYSDYYGAVPNEIGYYVKLAKKFITDKDGKEGKALCYYLAMRK